MKCALYVFGMSVHLSISISVICILFAVCMVQDFGILGAAFRRLYPSGLLWMFPLSFHFPFISNAKLIFSFRKSSFCPPFRRGTLKLSKRTFLVLHQAIGPCSCSYQLWYFSEICVPCIQHQSHPLKFDSMPFPSNWPACQSLVFFEPEKAKSLHIRNLRIRTASFPLGGKLTTHHNGLVIRFFFISRSIKSPVARTKQFPELVKHEYAYQADASRLWMKMWKCTDSTNPFAI